LSGTVLVIIFLSSRPREQLLTKGKVYTFRRGKLRKKLGSDWAAARRGGHKIADVIINPIIHVKPNHLEGALRPLVDYSGFDSVRDWLEEIYRINERLPEGWIYRVDTINRRSYAVMRPIVVLSGDAPGVVIEL